MRIEREVPLAGSFDFVVCGGGPSGIAAAVSASRLGLRTALIEKNHFFGGMGAGGYVVPLSGFFHQGVRVAGGIGWELVQRMVQDGHRPDVVFLDPPRAGSDERFLRSLLKAAPDRVIYVSCDPETLARDLKVLTAGGYQVRRIQPVDMFPWTEHIENVVLLQKLNS